MTKTKLKKLKKGSLDQFEVKTKVRNIDGTKFDVDVVVFVDGYEIDVFSGYANGKHIKTGKLSLEQPEP